MKYEIVFESGTDRHDTTRFSVRVSANLLAEKIAKLQADGQTIYAVRQSN